ncbi:lysophospholipase [Rhizobium leguminosarum]|uniref:GDSL-type esterase/lipase family protein n=1 Tax=Rhizobium leguminosarum TaxID=384 RepID=UPI001C974774|nr:GDSL-type esterase/lipase family protein [Rhizobium leguminosarum]MBY5766979.1 lysophospholipase [Rhizobium leguminosarum]
MYDFPAPIATNRYEDDVIAVLASMERRGIPNDPIALYGSSSIRLWHTAAEDLGALNLVNLGFGGGTNASGLHYFEKLLKPLKPRKIVLYFGENDISLDGLTGRSAFENFLKLRERITDDLPEAKVFFLSAKQSPAKWLYRDEVDEFNALAQSWCEEQPHSCYIDTTTSLLGENGRPLGRYYSGDHIHLNGSGYAVWARILRAVPDLLG